MWRWLGRSVLGCLIVAVFGDVTKPQNVRVNSVNFRTILKWDPPIYRGENITYTTQYVGQVCDLYRHLELHEKESRAGESSSAVESKDLCQSFVKSRAESEGKSDVPNNLGLQYICRNTVLTECMFLGLTFGCFCLSVRSEFKNNMSDWESIHFTPMEQTTIGPPTEVNVKSRSGLLDVSFVSPMYESEQRPLKEFYGSWKYTVRYWKKNNDSEVNLVHTKQNFEILSDLEPWTTYCLQVQASAPEYEKTGELSPVVCEKTTDDGKTPWWVTATAFLVSMAVVAGLVTGGFYLFSYISRVARYIFFPPCSFPQHLKEYLNKPSYSTQFPPTQSNEEDDELCHTLTVISESESCNENCADMGGKTAKTNQDSQERFPS